MDTLQERKNEFTPLFIVLGILFVTCLLISNIIAGKLIQVYGMVLPAAVILFPITYIFGDILTEVYGFKRSRLVIWTGFACNVLMVLVFCAVIALPHPSFWNGQDAYSTVLGMTPRLVIASLIAYFVGEFLNSVVLSKMKVLTNGRWLALRTIGSTVVGEGLDTLIFVSIAFFGVVPISVLIQMILLQYVWKVAYEVLLTPATYMVVHWIKRKEGIDSYDRDINYNPFSLKI